MQSQRQLDQFNQLAHAISAHNDTNALETLLKTHKDLDIQNNDGDTLLHFALELNPVNLVEVISLLLYAGADPHVLNRNGDSFLDALCSSKHILNEIKSSIFNVAVDYIDPLLIKAENKKFLPTIRCDFIPYFHSSRDDNMFDFHTPLDDDSVTIEILTSVRTFSFKDVSKIHIKKASPLFVQKYIDSLLRKGHTSPLLNVFNQYEIDPTFSFLDIEAKNGVITCIIENKFDFRNPQEKWAFIYKLYRLNFPLPPDMLQKAKQDVEAIAKLMAFCNNYNTPGLEKFLDENPNININIKLNDGRTLLDTAYTHRCFLQQQITQTAKKPIGNAEAKKDADSKESDKTEQEDAELLRNKGEAFFQLVLKKSNIHARTTNNQTFLHLVIINEERPPLIDIVHYLLRGASLSLKDTYEKSPLDYLTHLKKSDVGAAQDEEFKDPLAIHRLLFAHGIQSYLRDDAKMQLLYDVLVEEKKRLSNIDQDDETIRKEIIEFLKPLIDNFPIMIDAYGRTQLHWAIAANNVNNNTRSLQLIETEFKPNIIEIQDNDGNTSLHLAISYGNLPIVKALLIKGANLNILNEKKQSSICFACQRNHPNKTEILLEIIKLADLNKEAINLIFNAAYSQSNAKVIAALIEKYPSKIKINDEIINAPPSNNGHHNDVLYILFKHNILKKEELKDYENFIKCAIYHQHPNLVSILINEEFSKKYLDLMLTNNDEKILINAATLEVLLDKGKTFDISSAGQDGNTLLHIASDFKDDHPALWTKLLLNKGADPNKKNNKGFSPLHKAIHQLKPDLIEKLLQNGADPLLASSYRFIPFYRNTPLDYAKGLYNDFKSYPCQAQDDTAQSNQHFKKLFDTYPGKKRTILGSIMYFSVGFFHTLITVKNIFIIF